MNQYLFTFIDSSRAEAKLGASTAVLPVGSPEQFAASDEQFSKVVDFLEEFRRKNTPFWMKLFKSSTIGCMHDSALKTERAKRMMAKANAYMMPSSLLLSLAIDEIELNSLREATTILVLDGLFGAFYVVHAGGVVLSTFCKDLESAEQLKSFKVAIAKVMADLKAIKKEQSPLYGVQNRVMEEELQRENYWQSLPGLYDVALERGVYVFISETANPALVAKILDGSTLELKKRFDLRPSIWQGFAKFEKSLEKLPLSEYTKSELKN